ncbi:MAG TPA: twin-arginine translocation signal domain-containing protein [Variovorax sp.]
MDFTRRQVLQASATAGAMALAGLHELAWGVEGDQWNGGPLLHLIPTANHQRFLIKASFKASLDFTPRLTVNGKPVEGVRTDLAGRFWRFDVDSLTPATTYELQITDAGGKALCDPWPLKTYPAPDAKVERVRILSYTCAGGFDSKPLKGKSAYLDMAARRRLLARGMSYKPDIVIANGDHIYWDMTTAMAKVEPEYLKNEVWAKFGVLDLNVPMMHPNNPRPSRGSATTRSAGCTARHCARPPRTS